MPLPDDLELVADCSRCFGLCCVLLPFAAVSGFGIDKAGGDPCPNLLDDDRCGIHERLREDGWTGCTTFDCFGAGQQVSQVTYAGVSWREARVNRGEMAAVLTVMRLLHEMLAHLGEAVERTGDPALAKQRAAIRQLVDLTPEELLDLDLDELVVTVGDQLREVSVQVRGNGPRPDGDLAGVDLRGEVLLAADLRRAVLIAADLREVDLTDADLLGADLRDADLRGALLADALFLSQAQVNSAGGDRRTTLPARLTRPSHWSLSGPRLRIVQS